MAITTQIKQSNVDKVIHQTDCDETADDNIFDGSGSFFYIHAVNPHSNECWLKIYDTKSPTVGTTAPDFQLHCKGNVTQTVLVRSGVVLSKGLSIAATKEAGTAGTTTPDGNLAVTIVGA